MALENAHKEEIKDLNNKWSNIILPQNENEASLMELDLKRRHQAELADLKDAIESGSFSRERVHYSATVLELIKKAD